MSGVDIVRWSVPGLRDVPPHQGLAEALLVHLPFAPSVR